MILQGRFPLYQLSVAAADAVSPMGISASAAALLLFHRLCFLLFFPDAVLNVHNLPTRTAHSALRQHAGSAWLTY